MRYAQQPQESREIVEWAYANLKAGGIERAGEINLQPEWYQGR
jgi:hypothetical protein